MKDPKALRTAESFDQCSVEGHARLRVFTTRDSIRVTCILFLI